MNIIERHAVTVMDGPQPTLLYAHGFGCSQDMWSAVSPSFSGRNRQILFNYLGANPSARPIFDIEKYSQLEGYAQDLLDVCDELGLTENIILVAHSVSCSIGMLAAIARPDLFQHIVMVGPNPCFINDPPYVGGFARGELDELLDVMDHNYMGWAEFLAPVVAGDSPETASALHKSFCSTDPVMARAFAKATFFADNRSDLAKVPVPCTILQHRFDALAPAAVGEFMHAHLPKSELKFLEVHGHCAHMSHPDLVINVIRSILPAQ